METRTKNHKEPPGGISEGDPLFLAVVAVGMGGLSLPRYMNPVGYSRCFSEPEVSLNKGSVLKFAGGASAKGLAALISLPAESLLLPPHAAAARHALVRNRALPRQMPGERVTERGFQNSGFYGWL